MGEAAETAVPRKAVPTLRQERLAKTMQTANSRKQALLEAGYGLGTALGSAKRTLEAAGTRVSLDTLQSKRLDSARGLAGLSAKAAAYADDDIKQLEARDRVALVIKAAEAAAALGEDVQQRGHGRTAKDKRMRGYRLLRYLILAQLGQLSLIRSDYVNTGLPPSAHDAAPVIDAEVVADGAD